jgi:hypothetical protein
VFTINNGFMIICITLHYDSKVRFDFAGKHCNPSPINAKFDLCRVRSMEIDLWQTIQLSNRAKLSQNGVRTKRLKD